MSLDYLLKTEPSEYSFADSCGDAATDWEGVSNPAAVKNLREMSPGARLIIYETGERKSAVGTATVVSVDASDPKNPIVQIKAGKAIANRFPLRKSKQQTVQRFAARPPGQAFRGASYERAIRDVTRILKNGCAFRRIVIASERAESEIGLKC